LNNKTIIKKNNWTTNWRLNSYYLVVCHLPKKNWLHCCVKTKFDFSKWIITFYTVCANSSRAIFVSIFDNLGFKHLIQKWAVKLKSPITLKMSHLDIGILNITFSYRSLETATTFVHSEMLLWYILMIFLISRDFLHSHGGLFVSHSLSTLVNETKASCCE
jgi:hypothetical protein